MWVGLCACVYLTVFKCYVFLCVLPCVGVQARTFHCASVNMNVYLSLCVCFKVCSYAYFVCVCFHVVPGNNKIHMCIFKCVFFPLCVSVCVFLSEFFCLCF